MPLYEFACDKCGRHDDRFIRVADYDRDKHLQRCECGSVMRKVITPTGLIGLDSGPTGFMRGRVESDGCADAFTRKRVERNLGRSIGGGVWVPGLCPPGEQFSGKAVCYSRQEVIDKARKLGVAVRGPGINVEPRISEAEHKAREEAESGDYAPSEQALKHTIRAEAIKRHNGRLSGRQYKDLVVELKDKHGAKKRPKLGRSIESIYPKGT